MIDPMERWREFGEKPDFAGLLTFSALPYTEDPVELEGVDIAIVQVIPKAVGSTDLTCLVADRIVREIATGIAMRPREGQSD